MELNEIAGIMANVRKIHKKSKATTNTQLYLDIFGGSKKRGEQMCRDLGLDPTGNRTDFMFMIKYIKTMRNKRIPY